MQQKRITMYTSEVGFDFLNSLPGDKLTLTNRWRRVITILDTVLQDGKIGRIKPQWVSFDMPGEIGEIAKSFLAKKKSQLVSSITVQVYNRMLGRLISFLSIKEVTSLSKMSERRGILMGQKRCSSSSLRWLRGAMSLQSRT
jgi:hypothetical protein